MLSSTTGIYVLRLIRVICKGSAIDGKTRAGNRLFWKRVSLPGGIRFLEAFQAEEMETFPDSDMLPVSESAQAGYPGNTAHFLGQVFPRNIGLKDKEDSANGLAVGYSGATPFGLGWLRWQQRLDKLRGSSEAKGLAIATSSRFRMPKKGWDPAR